MKLSTVVLLLILSLSSALPAQATIYSWQDENGVQIFTDDPSAPPKDAKVEVWDPSSVRSVSSITPPETLSSEPSSAPPEGIQQVSSRVVTEGEFAVQLATELGLSKTTDPKEAAELLTRVRIAPPLGRWELDESVTPDLTVRLRALTVAATDEGWLSLTPEEALLAFDTAAALAGVAIPTAPPSEDLEPPYQEAVLPPPLVYLYPPPTTLFSYYSWVPVTGGFWWYNTWFGGYFVLTNFHPHPFHHHRFVFDSGFLRHRFSDRIGGHRREGSIGKTPDWSPPRNPGPIRRRGSGFSSPPPTNRPGPFFSTPPRPGSRPPGMSRGRGSQSVIIERPSFQGVRPPSFSRPARPSFGPPPVSPQPQSPAPQPQASSGSGPGGGAVSRHR
jgi:hypothetical protein